MAIDREILQNRIDDLEKQIDDLVFIRGETQSKIDESNNLSLYVTLCIV